ncbi:MAG: hypothetical protein AAF602_13920, partial [Myxococcota bacterium]
MDAQDYRRAYSLFMAVADLDAAERTRALDDACGDDTSLREFVNQLLEDATRSSVEDVVARVVSVASGAIELSVGARLLDRFEVRELLGRGGTSSVWRVRDTQVRQDHALKVLEQIGSTGPERMRRERAFQDQVQHRNVVAVQEL